MPYKKHKRILFFVIDSSPTNLYSIFNKVFALNHESAHGHFLRGNLRARQGKSQEAQKELKKSLKIDPNHQDALFRLGWLYGHSGKAYAGRPLFEKLKEIDPLTPGWTLISGAIEFFDGRELCPN